MVSAFSATPPALERRHGALLELPCPECTGFIRLARGDVIEDVTIRCRQCDCEAMVTRKFRGAGGSSPWRLMDPLADYSGDARGD
jgi:hypothetical protein